jgi:hypothetical protein
MARVALSRPVAQMCPTPRGPPRQTQLADKDATYSERAHNCRFVPGNKTAVLHLGQGVEAGQAHLAAFFFGELGPLCLEFS